MTAEERHKRELLRRWIAGELNARGERELMLLAQQDSFLQEAMEGYVEHSEIDHVAALSRIRKRLQNTEDRKVIPMIFWQRIAAVIVFVLIAGAGIWYFNQPDMQIAEERSRNETVQPEAASPVVNSEDDREEPSAKSIPEPQETQALTPPPPVEEPKVVEKLKSAKKDAPPATEKEADFFADVMLEEEETKAADDTAPNDFADLSLIEEPQFIPATRTNPGFDMPKVPLREVSGKVFDDLGEPLIGATVLAPELNKGTVTNYEGYYQLALPDTFKGNLQVNYVGYQSKQFNLTDSNQYQIVLDQSAVALDEVVVTGYEKRRVQEVTSAMTTAEAGAKTDQDDFMAKPVSGYQVLTEYISKNMQKEEIFIRGIRGTVTLNFTVDANGQPSEFEVIKSLCSFCDEEAKRLLRDGPKWQPIGAKGSYTVTY